MGKSRPSLAPKILISSSEYFVLFSISIDKNKFHACLEHLEQMVSGDIRRGEVFNYEIAKEFQKHYKRVN
jgi:hypothetical protein